MRGGVEYPPLPLRWIVAVFVAWLFAVAMTAAFACQPVPTCSDPGTIPGYECATPTPTLRWDYSESWQNDLVAYRVYYRSPLEQWSLDRSWTVGCWIYEDTDTGAFSRAYCYGRDLDVPVQRNVERDLTDVEYAVTAIDRWGVESLNKSNSVYVCQPELWRGGPYD